MTSDVASETSELVRELRRLCAALPLPQPTWHPYVAEITACRHDFERALALAAGRPAALETLAELIESEIEPSLGANATPWVAAAGRRLETLPLPGGQHPYLDDILPTLDALRLLLAALGRTGS